MSSHESNSPLTPLMGRVLDAMPLGHAMTPNEIGSAIGLHAGDVSGGRGQGGRGSGHRSFGPAQRIIPTLTALRRRGLIHHAQRPDGLSGSAYVRPR
jgi:hypothetical protein